MAGDAAAFGQHGGGGMHAANILGRRLTPDEDARLTACSTCLRVAGGKDDPPGGRAGAGGDAAPDHVPLGTWVDLAVQQFRQRARLHPHERFLAADDPLIGQRHGDAHGSPRGTRNLHTVQDMQLALIDHKLDLHLGPQPLAHQRRVILQLGKGFGHQFFKRWPARITGEIHRRRIAFERVAALALAQIPPGDLRQAGIAIDQLQHARTALPLPHAKGHFLNHQPQPRIRRRALSLPEQPRRGAVPRPRHGAQHSSKLGRRVLGKTLFGLGLIGA